MNKECQNNSTIPPRDEFSMETNSNIDSNHQAEHLPSQPIVVQVNKNNLSTEFKNYPVEEIAARLSLIISRYFIDSSFAVFWEEQAPENSTSFNAIQFDETAFSQASTLAELTDQISTKTQSVDLSGLIESNKKSGYAKLVALSFTDHTNNNIKAVKSLWQPDEIALSINIDGTCDSIKISIRSKPKLCSKLIAVSLSENIENLFILELDAAISNIINNQVISDKQKDFLSKNCIGKTQALSPEPIFKQIEKLAKSNPEDVAIQYENDELTYAQLNSLSNQLAGYLKHTGVMKGDKVALILPPSELVPVCILAIFKLGAIYTPIDFEFPLKRIELILEDTEPKLIISSSEIFPEALTNLTAYSEISHIFSTLDKYPSENLETSLNLKEIAYIYYTSGTTGKPKGILASHSNLNNYLQTAQTKYSIGKDDIMAACARFTFSISMFELFYPLVNGARLRILKRSDILNVQKFATIFSELTFLHLGPSLLKLLLNHIDENGFDKEKYRNLRHLSSGGDMVPPELLQLARKLFPDIDLFVIYGCSEISCMGTTWELPKDQDILRTYVGKPFNNTKLIILDNHDNPLPVGVIGNICFSGKGVINGYLNNEDLNNEKFLKFNDERFYRIGDRGRITDDGNLELLGRSDFQIQLHGLRIEPTEIEFYIKKYPSIKDCVVASKLQNGNHVLVAFYVLNIEKDSAFSSQSLRESLLLELPDYMVPSRYVELDKLPLNHNFKVDRASMPELQDENRHFHSNNGTPPKTETEKTLCEIWLNLLPISHVYLEDNFFEIGGDSLLAIALISEVEKQLKVTLYGLDVARESLGILANKIDPLSNTILTVKETDALEISAPECQFIGKNKSIYSVFHPAKGEQKSKSILICPPLGFEYTRSYSQIKLLCTFLSERGYPVLKFDYYGTGNSKGYESDCSIARWLHDQKIALDYLQSYTKCKEVAVIGVRLGGSMAVENFAQQKNTELLLWDPIINGHSYIEDMKRTQRNILKLIQYLKSFAPSRFKTHNNEILGLTYDDNSIAYLEALRLTLTPAENMNYIFSSDYCERQVKSPDELPHQKLAINCHWFDYSCIDEAIFSSEISHAVLEVIEGFEDE